MNDRARRNSDLHRPFASLASVGERVCSERSRKPGVRRRSPASRQNRIGFTLVEVIAAIVVLAVIGSVASRTIITALDGYMSAATQAQLHTELSTALDRIERELRKIPLKSGSIAPNISSLTSSSIAWEGNSSLSRSGSQLMFVENGSSAAIMLENVTAFSVTAFDENNAALGATLSGAGCDPIRRIAVQITVQRSGVTETLRTKLYLRTTMQGASS